LKFKHIIIVDTLYVFKGLNKFKIYTVSMETRVFPTLSSWPAASNLGKFGFRPDLDGNKTTVLLKKHGINSSRN